MHGKERGAVICLKCSDEASEGSRAWQMCMAHTIKRSAMVHVINLITHQEQLGCSSMRCVVGGCPKTPNN